MRLSLNVTDFSWPGGPPAAASYLGEVAAVADASALDTLWVGDHLRQADPGVAPDSPMLEAGTALAWLASRTRRIRLGTMVAAVTFRPAALLIKAVTTLDVLSGGRAWLGIGAGYHRDEATELGLPMPPPAERFAQLDDTLALARQMWRGDRRPFVGQRIHALSAVLDAHCDDIGRPPETVERTVSTRLGDDESSDAFVDRCGHLADLGIDHVVAICSGPWTPTAVKVLAAAADQLADVPTHAPRARSA